MDDESDFIWTTKRGDALVMLIAGLVGIVACVVLVGATFGVGAAALVVVAVLATFMVCIGADALDDRPN